MLTEPDHETKRVSAFFSNLINDLGTQTATDTVAVCVAHVLQSAPPFLSAVASLAPIAALVPKPKSQHRPTVAWAKRQFKCSVIDASRDQRFLEALVHELKKPRLRGKRLVLVDIGGYFAPVLNELVDAAQSTGSTVVGVMEGTENGAQLYDRLYPPDSEAKAPVVTVARSPLKLPEDFLVGSSIVFSVESILRSHGQILQTRSACVIGFGRVGSAVASALRGRGIPTIVNDIHPVRMAEAAAQGYQVYPNVYEAVSRSSLIVSATSAGALDERVLASLRNGAAVATVTSRDTEFSDEGHFLDLSYDRTVLHPSSVVRYDEKGVDRYFWLLSDGDAPNFMDGAVLGPALQLIEGEKLAAISGLISHTNFDRIHGRTALRQVGEDDRLLVATVWNEHFIGT